MPRMEKNKALMILSKLIEDGRCIKNLHYDSLQYRKWENDIEVTITNIFGAERFNRYNEKFSRVKSYLFDGDNDLICQKYYCEDVDIAMSFLQSLIDEINTFWEESKVAEPSVNNVFTHKAVIQVIDRFYIVTRQLLQRYNLRETLKIADEYDVQDLFHALLKLYFDDIRDEEWTPSYAGSSSRIDFFIPELKLAVEIKKTRNGLGNKEAKEQLAIDKDHYRRKENIKHLICFVYDPDGRIQNPRGFEKDLAQEGPLKTDVYVRP